MPPELLAAILGPMVGAIFGITGFMSRRNINVTDKQLDEIKETIELVSHQVTSIQIQLPSNYVTKEELETHIAKEERHHNAVLREIRELREEIIVLRVNTHQ
jgi:archaellum component FlaC